MKLRPTFWFYYLLIWIAFFFVVVKFGIDRPAHAAENSGTVSIVATDNVLTYQGQTIIINTSMIRPYAIPSGGTAYEAQALVKENPSIHGYFGVLDHHCDNRVGVLYWLPGDGARIAAGFDFALGQEAPDTVSKVAAVVCGMIGKVPETAPKQKGSTRSA